MSEQFTSSEDPVLASLMGTADEGDFGKADVEYPGAYGVGKWPKASILEVNTAKSNPGFPYRVKVVFQLDPEKEKSKYTGLLDLPRTVDASQVPAEKLESAKRGVEANRNRLNTVLIAADIVKSGGGFLGSIDNESRYDWMVSLFRAAIGRTCAIEVTEKVKKVNDKWQGTGFTQFSGLPPTK